MQDKSEKDSNFIDPEEEFRRQKEKEEEERMNEEQEDESDEMSDDRELYDAQKAYELYQLAQTEIPISIGIGIAAATQ
jgi:hypothetical protein